jgi:hypothetical protein
MSKWRVDHILWLRLSRVELRLRLCFRLSLDWVANVSDEEEQKKPCLPGQAAVQATHLKPAFVISDPLSAKRVVRGYGRHG